MDSQSEKLENFNRIKKKKKKILTELQSMKNNQTEMENTITVKKNTPKGINNRLNDTED